MPLIRFIVFLMLCPVAVFSQEIHQQDSVSEQLKEVVITGTRAERQIATLPLPAHIINSESINRAGITRLNEILSEQTGLITVPDFGGVEGIQIQGLDSAYTMILVDGVPLVGRSAGTLDLSRISVGNIEKIEIIKGASSSLYGSEAMAGVINIITKKPKYDMFSGNFSNRYASFNTIDSNLDVSWKKRKLTASLFANSFATDGFDLDKSTDIKTVDPFQNYTIQPKLGYEFSDKVIVLLTSRYFNQVQENQLFVQNEIFSGEAKIAEWNNHARINYKHSEKLLTELELYATNYKASEFLSGSSQVLDDNFYNQWLLRPEFRATYTLNKGTFTAGLGLNHETLDRTNFASKAVFDSQFLFLQYDYKPVAKWNLLAGFRYDNHQQFKSQFSPKLAVNYQLNNNFSVKSSVGFGFKAPDFRQLYFDFTNSSVGYTVLGYNVVAQKLQELQNAGQILFTSANLNFNDPLKPESSINVNLGTFYQKKKIRIDTNIFYNAIENLIDTKVVAQRTNGQNVFSYFNVDQIFTYGFESNMNYNVTKNFNIAIGYQYLIAKDKSIVENIKNGQLFARNPNTLESFSLQQSDYVGLLNRSKHTANVKMFYTIKPLKTDLNYRIFYRSKYGIIDSNSNQILDDYDDFVDGFFLSNLSISRQFFEHYALQIGANNLFDFTNPAEIGNIAGRQIFGRLQINF